MSKYVLIVVVAALAVASCGRGRPSRKLVLADSLSTTDPDSAYNILFSMTSFDISSEEDMAYYGMLMSYVFSKLTLKTDTVPLSYSIDYYERTNNQPMLQRCWLYMGTIRMKRGAPLASVEADLKKAEGFIGDVGDTLVAMKAYERLTMVNIRQGDTCEALRYARRLEALSHGARNAGWRMRGLSAMALAMSLDGRRDSMLAYVEMAERCMPDSSCPAISHVYDKLAFMQMRTGYGDPALVERLLKKSLGGGSDWRTLNMLADLYLKTGREDEAFQLIDGLMAADNAKANVWTYNILSEYYASKGKFEDAYLMRCKRDSVMTVVDKLLDAEFTTDMWQRYDADVVKGFARRKAALAVFIVLVVVVLVLAVLVVSGRRLRKRAAVISALKTDLLEMQLKVGWIRDDKDKTIKEKTEQLQAIVNDKQAAINKLMSRLSVSEDEINGYSARLDNIEHGLYYLYRAMRNDNISQLNKAGREAVIECYRVIDAAFVHRIEDVAGSKLTIQEKLFCVLRNMGKDSEDIKSMLCLSDEAYRKTRSRTLSKLSGDSKLVDIADKIK